MKYAERIAKMGQSSLQGISLLTWIIMFIMFSIIGTGVARSCCTENWTAGARAAHSGCTAGPINAGDVSYTGATTLWRHHIAPYTKGSNSDIDCRQNTDCTYTDVSETSFSCTWAIEQYNGTWVQVGTFSGDCSSGNWDTAPDTDKYEPGKLYRARADTDDTPADGPYGDDAAVSKWSGSKILTAPGITGWNISGGCIGSGENGRTEPLHHTETWQSDCGHLEHLDKVTTREKVTYESNWTSGGWHNMRHPDGQGNPTTSFTATVEDPSILSFSGTQGAAGDTQHMPTCSSPWMSSHCQGTQVIQWASGWPDAPLASNENANWHTLNATPYVIDRYIVIDYDQDHSGWWYYITKDRWGKCWCDVPDN